MGRLSQIFSERVLPGAKAVQTKAFETAIFKYRISWPSHFGRKFVGGCHLKIDFGVGDSEELAGEIVPRATTFAGCMI